jgi:uncharacterized protein
MGNVSREQITGIFAWVKTIAVVGASRVPAKAAHRIPRYMYEQGYQVLPVSPRGGELFGQPVRGTLAEVPGPIDMVDVFRPPAEAETVARQAVACGARVLWFQLDTETDEAVRIAASAGLTVVTGHCLMVAHASLSGSSGLPGSSGLSGSSGMSGSSGTTAA